MLIAKGDVAAAEALLREAVSVKRGVFGDQHPEYAQTLGNLAGTVEAQRRLEEAQALLEECLRIARPRLTDDHPRVLAYTVNLARVRIARGAWGRPARIG